MVCPILGFVEFLHSDWLIQIMNWQKPNGCYGKMMRSDLGKYSNNHYEYEEHDTDKEKGVPMDDNEIRLDDYDHNKQSSHNQKTERVEAVQGHGSG